ncbi:MAG: polysaccharide deacetylase family protein [Vicinamibacteria bacterium]
MEPSRERLRLLVLTAGPLTSFNRVLYERLASDPLLELCAVVVDGFERPRAPLSRRVLRGLERDGWRWPWFKVRTRLAAAAGRLARAAWEAEHPAVVDDSYEAFAAASGVAVHRVADVHAEASLALIRSLRPRLGLIVGGRILEDAVTGIPELGTLNIHKRRVPDYRGGGPVGYWELRNGEREIGVTIHYARAAVDAGDVVAEARIPVEECDTLESLRIKADLRGARLYHEAVRRVALGEAAGRPQDLARGRTYRAPSELAVWRLERDLRRRAERRMPSLRARPGVLSRARVLVQYLLLYPLLRRWRRRFARESRMPGCILFYHLVANRPLNHMCLPLEEFARQMEFLRRHCRLVSLDGAARSDGRAGLPEVAISFDDGYRDNTWAIEYLDYFAIPATFFVSIGHLLDGSPFEHDVARGFAPAPMSAQDLRRLASRGFEIGSHGIRHEDFGRLAPAEAERVLEQSRRLIADAVGRPPERFSFPKGRWPENVTREGLALALRRYRQVYSASGGYNHPDPERRHFLRRAHPSGLLELATLLDGYTGFRECLAGRAWGLRSELPASVPREPAPPPESSPRKPNLSLEEVS